MTEPAPSTLHHTAKRPTGWLRRTLPPTAGGIGFTLVIALIGYALAGLPGLGSLGQLAWAILIAALYRQLFGYPERIRIGIQFTAKRLLRLAIVLYGLKLNMFIIFQQGLGLMLKDMLSVVFAISLTLLIARWLKADMSLSLLLGIGTGVCGAARLPPFLQS